MKIPPLELIANNSIFSDDISESKQYQKSCVKIIFISIDKIDMIIETNFESCVRIMIFLVHLK